MEYDYQDFRLIMVAFNKKSLDCMVLGPRLRCWVSATAQDSVKPVYHLYIKK